MHGCSPSGFEAAMLTEFGGKELWRGLHVVDQRVSKNERSNHESTKDTNKSDEETQDLLFLLRVLRSNSCSSREVFYLVLCDQPMRSSGITVCCRAGISM
jgi:hypothetical protein